MFNTSSWQSHSEYRTNFRNCKARFSSDLRMPLHNEFYRVSQKLLSINLDLVGHSLSRLYPPSGRPALNQAQILRSFILFTLLFNRTSAKTSLSLWVSSTLPSNPLFIALVGCRSADELPPLGSYFDFIKRLWKGDSSIYGRNRLFPAAKNGKKPKKDIGPDGKLAEDDAGKTKDLTDAILSGKPTTSNPESILQDVFFLAAVIPSVRKGIVSPDRLTLSGDGTVVPSHSDCWGHRLPSSPASDLSRHYSDPEASWGWDSSKKNWYFGHTLYMLCSRNNDLCVELPLLMKFTDAKRHDSLNFLYAFDEYLHHSYALVPQNICLDSAHDNMATYHLLDHFGINALIDLNMRSNSIEGIPPGFSLDKDAHPHCPSGHKMVSWGNDSLKDAHKYRCPLACGRIDSCPHADKCSSSAYGRTIYIKNHSSLRFHTRIPRDSDLYKAVYKERTACERVNNRVLNDYKLQFLRIHGRMRFSFWTMVIGICIHLDAWEKADKLTAS